MKASDLARLMEELGQRARRAAALAANATNEVRSAALMAAAEALMRDKTLILEANARDMARAREMDRDAAFLDRLALDGKRVAAMADGLVAIAKRPDPLGVIDRSWTMPNGLVFERVRTAIGVIAVIFESRPNVAADAAGLCLKSGNAVILRGGSESTASVSRILTAIREGLLAAGLPEDAVQQVPVADRAAVGHLLGMTRHVDLLIPRGGRSLVARVEAESRVPVLAHLMGVNHSYVHESADPDKAEAVLLNAKMRRPGICGATETLLIDRSIAPAMLPRLAMALSRAGCRLRGDDASVALSPLIEPGTAEDYDTEWLDAVLSVRIVAGIDEALDHIARHGTHHSEAIIAEDRQAAERFLDAVDAAIVFHNCSTQFADGGEFGFGAEIGIATGRLHARGPVGAEHLTIYKYKVRGTGQTRP
ncbi:MAG: glutamate-5-semialdehyde dehydrogenase [Rhodothalassiaceae bacterium]